MWMCRRGLTGRIANPHGKPKRVFESHHPLQIKVVDKNVKINYNTYIATVAQLDSQQVPSKNQVGGSNPSSRTKLTTPYIMINFELATDVASVTLILEEFGYEIPQETKVRVMNFLDKVTDEISQMEDTSAETILNHILTKYGV